MKRAALYARTSTARDQRPEVQLDELRTAANQRGWYLVGEYVDRGISGSKDRRPELDRLNADVLRGRVDLVAVYRFDRYARSVRHLVSTLEEYRASNVDFVSLHDGIDTSTPHGRFTFHVISAVAELEREIIRERVRSGVQAARRRGQTLGRPRVHLDVSLARALRASGASYRAIALRLGTNVATLHRALNESRTTVTESAANDATQVPNNETAI